MLQDGKEYPKNSSKFHTNSLSLCLQYSETPVSQNLSISEVKQLAFHIN